MLLNVRKSFALICRVSSLLVVGRNFWTSYIIVMVCNSLLWCFFCFCFRCRFYHIERWIKIYIYINYTVTKNKQIVFTITLKLFHKYPSNLANSVGYKCLTMNKITFGVSRSMERRHVLSIYFLACFHCVSSLVKNTLYVVVCVIYVYLLITLRAS